MRRHRAGAVKGIAALLSAFLLWSAGKNLGNLQELERLGIYETDSGIDRRRAEYIMDQAVSAKESFLFFAENKRQTVENSLWRRQIKTTVVEICGDSTLLFPFGYPLENEDGRGCLLGEESARTLFGGTEVTGEKILYEGRTYEIRGILPERNILVIEAGENTRFSYVGIWGETPLQKDDRREMLQNLGGVFLTEIPLRFYSAIVRLEILAAAALLYGLAVSTICCRFPEKRALKKIFGAAAVFLGAAGLIFVLSITAYRMPDKVSDLSRWETYFREEGQAWDSFFGREELFLQEDYKRWLY